MIYAIGIDSVEIERFAHWITKSDKSLSRILSQEEILYCRSSEILAPERFAARFALREAFFKALSNSDNSLQWPFLSICKAVFFKRLPTGPLCLIIDWKILEKIHSVNQWIKDAQWHISVTHTQSTATAFIVCSKSSLK